MLGQTYSPYAAKAPHREARSMAAVTLIAFAALASCVSAPKMGDATGARVTIALGSRVPLPAPNPAAKAAEPKDAQAPKVQPLGAGPKAEAPSPRLDENLPTGDRQVLAKLLGPAESSKSLDGAIVRWRGKEIDPEGQISRPLLVEVLTRLERDLGPEQASPPLAIVDFAKATPEPRLYLVDLQTGKVAAHHVAHGHGARAICRRKGANCVGGRPPLTHRAEIFSNRMNTDASSIGLYQVTASTQGCVEGACGPKIVLAGLDPTNDKALERGIIFHKNPRYFDPKTQRWGRSRGCFVVAPEDIDRVVAHLPVGAMVYAGPAKLHDSLQDRQRFAQAAPAKARPAATQRQNPKLAQRLGAERSRTTIRR